MGCAHCVAAVRSALEGLDVQILDVTIGRADIRYESGGVDDNEIDAAVSSAGYRVISHEK